MMPVVYFILLPIFFTVIGEFLLKHAVDGMAIGFDFQSVMQVVGSFEIIIGVLLIIVAAAMWIVGMSKFQLSFMYPFLSLNYVIIIVGSDLFLGERVAINRYVSILFIIIGLVIVSRSPNIKIKE